MTTGYSSALDDAPLLALTGVRRLYAMGEQTVTALDGIDLAIRAGEFVAIIGPSGSGKSTLLNILGCLDRPSEGSYRVAGRETRAMRESELAALRRHMFGFVFQGYNLLPRLSARANVELPALYAGMTHGHRSLRATTLLADLELATHVTHRPAQLSGGQQQRVGIARALMNGGAVLLADEPTGALDSRTGAEVLALFRTLCTRGHTILIVTHDMAVAERADRIVEIRDGRIVSDRSRAAPTGHALAPVDHQADGGLRRRLGVAAQGLRTVAHHRLRNALTLLGIVVGIAAVILASDAGSGAEKKVMTEMSGLGVDVTRIYAGNPLQAGSRPVETLVAQDMERLAALPFVAGATPDEKAPTTFRFKSRAVKGQVVAASGSFLRINAFQIAEGRNFTSDEVEAGSPVLILTKLARAALFEDNESPLGAVVLVGAIPARVIGVATSQSLNEYANIASGMFPYRAFQARLGGHRSFSALRVVLSEGSPRPIALGALDKLLSAWHGRHDFFLLDEAAFIKARLRTQATLDLLTTSLALIALAVGAIGVTNMMLVSVSERTPEIGILKAMGARTADIRLQIMVEAVVLCVVGGLCGAVLAYLVEKAAPGLGLPATLAFSWAAAAVGILASSVAGFLAGVLPAHRAANIDPVQAISR